MKVRGILLTMIVGPVFTLQAQFTEITGISKKSRAGDVKLFKVLYGRIEEIAAARPAANGAFSFKFKPDYKGFYLIGSGNASQGIQDKFKLYVKGDDKISIVLNDTAYLLNGKNNRQNQVLEQWYKFVYRLERKTVYFNRGRRSFSDFFPILDGVTTKAETWLAGKKTGDADFDQLMKSVVLYEPAYFALTLLVYPSASKPPEEQYTRYVKDFNADRFLRGEELFRFPYGVNMMENLVEFRNKGLNYDFDKNLMCIQSDVLKGEYLLREAATVKSYTRYAEIMDRYSKYFLTDDQKIRAEAIATKMAGYRPGARAFNFTYPDISGNKVSLSDFKGKVVLVDVWATWCGPCKKEIPHLQALEKTYQGKDVVFLSVSVDEERDRDKWEKFVAEEHLGGVQLRAGGWSDITKAYKINGIPRFMLFDKNGNIIDIDAPRPSDERLKALLNEWLEKP